MRSAAALLLVLVPCSEAAAAPQVEWALHRTADGAHPDGLEQAWLWQMNRARQDPAAEGARLPALDDPLVQLSYDVFATDLDLLEAELAALPPSPPAAFDRRLWTASRDHAQAMIDADAAFVPGQLDRILPAGFVYPSIGAVAGNAYGFAANPVHGHAAWAANWGAGPGGMADGRPNRAILLGALSNVGIAVLPDPDAGDLLGPLVAVASHADANPLFADHHDRFLVGTVWEDLDGDGGYDPGEGLGGVGVVPDAGGFFAVTAAGGGFAIPVTSPGTFQVAFAGAGVPARVRQVTVGEDSVLVDYQVPEPSPPLAGLAAAGALAMLARRAGSARPVCGGSPR
ncbi:MAG: hypothetical protein OZ948_14735 [Deltaproteobacteria bacterium]|nr:hypothetical protein [Deltaproteobacteria bacterium]